MSKSLGNVTCPFGLLEKYGVNSVRAYMLAEGPYSKDANFDERRLLELHNTFLADQYVNLLNRCIGKKFLQKMPTKIVSTGHFSELSNEVSKLAQEAD
jgi:methionyl-tRNA synthetase